MVSILRRLTVHQQEGAFCGTLFPHRIFCLNDSLFFPRHGRVSFRSLLYFPLFFSFFVRGGGGAGDFLMFKYFVSWLPILSSVPPCIASGM